MYKSLFFILVFLLPFHLYSGAGSIEVSAPSSVNVGERFRVTFKMNEHPSRFEAPGFEGFRILSGPQHSTSTSIQIINGKQTRTQTVSYIYIIEALKEGDFNIDPAKAIIDDDPVQSESFTINVIKPDAPASRPSDTQQRADGGKPEIFVRAQASNYNPYQGEQVMITYKVYTRVSIRRYAIERLPSYQGFWSENITDYDRARQQSSETIDGQRYQVAEIRRVALFPQRSGELTIDPLEVECYVRRTIQQQQDSWLDDFFSSPFGRTETVREVIKSNRIKLNVKPLPTQNRPATFKGLVGNFELSTSLEDEQLQANDATTLSVTLSGNGNLRMAESPHISFPVNLDTYDPKITDNIRTGLSGVSGNRTWEYLLIPRTEGEFEIPKATISYFDPKDQTYKTLTGQTYTLNVEGGYYAASTDDRQPGHEVEYFERDIRHIYLRNIGLQQAGKLFFRSTAFYILFALPFVLIAVFIILYYRKLRNESNLALMRTRQANRVAKKRLKKAEKLLKQNKDNDFYDEISRTLWGYISDKLNIPVSELNTDNVREKLTIKNVPDDITEDFIKTLDHCEYARFAPGDKEKNMDEVFSMSLETIVKIEKWVKM